MKNPCPRWYEYGICYLDNCPFSHDDEMRGEGRPDAYGPFNCPNEDECSVGSGRSFIVCDSEVKDEMQALVSFLQGTRNVEASIKNIYASLKTPTSARACGDTTCTSSTTSTGLARTSKSADEVLNLQKFVTLTLPEKKRAIELFTRCNRYLEKTLTRDIMAGEHNQKNEGSSGKVHGGQDIQQGRKWTDGETQHDEPLLPNEDTCAETTCKQDFYRVQKLAGINWDDCMSFNTWNVMSSKSVYFDNDKRGKMLHF